MVPAVVEHDLASIGRALVERLGGRWTGRGGLCLCPAHADRSPSLSIRVGDYGLLYHCFAGCRSVDVLHAIRDIDRRGLVTVPATSALYSGRPVGPSPRLQSLWAEAHQIAGSPAARYFSTRGLGPVRQGVRFHPRVPLGSGADLCFRPAILCALHDGPDLLALHRTFLSTDGMCLAPDVGQPRRMLGRPGRGAVRLARVSTVLGIAEGLETALSAMILLGVPVWAALGNERLPHLTIPLSVRRLLILADDDAAGHRSAAAAAEAHAVPGRQVRRLWPGRGFTDWNDRLMAGGKGVGSRVRRAV
jgi:hypothetical protein